MYVLLRAIAGIALRWYYRDIHVEGIDRIPRRRPLLLVVNHPNALGRRAARRVGDSSARVDHGEEHDLLESVGRRAVALRGRAAALSREGSGSGRTRRPGAESRNVRGGSSRAQPRRNGADLSRGNHARRTVARTAQDRRGADGVARSRRRRRRRTDDRADRADIRAQGGAAVASARAGRRADRDGWLARARRHRRPPMR